MAEARFASAIGWRMLENKEECLHYSHAADIFCFVRIVAEAHFGMQDTLGIPVRLSPLHTHIDCVSVCLSVSAFEY